MDRILALVEVSELISGIGFYVMSFCDGDRGKSRAVGLRVMIGMVAMGSTERAVALARKVSAEGEEVDGTEHWKTGFRGVLLVMDSGRKRGLVTYWKLLRGLLRRRTTSCPAPTPTAFP